MVGAEYFRLKNICDCQKELDNKIDQNKEVVKKQGRQCSKIFYKMQVVFQENEMW